MHTARLLSVRKVSGEVHVLHVSERISSKELDSLPQLCGLSVQLDCPTIYGLSVQTVQQMIWTDGLD